MLISLFWAFFTIGAIAFGGGYAMLPLFERVIVDDRGWLSMALFTDMIAISQVTPGPIAINSATFIGFTMAGVLGALVSTVGVIFIPVSLVIVVSRYYNQFKKSPVVKGIFTGLRPALVGLIAASAFSVAENAIIDLWGIGLLVVTFVLVAKLKWHPIIVILFSGLAGMLIYYVL